MVQRNLGEATIVYESEDGSTEEETVENERIAYFQDHWMIKTGEDERGRDIVRRIPVHRVYHVERSVEEFEREIKTLRDQVQGIADDLRSKVLGGGSTDRVSGSTDTEPTIVEVKNGDVDEDE